MTTPILICDDSSFARKQMARALPAQWDVEVSFAANGAEGLEAIRQGKGHILFLDLNMPVMDGYQVLQEIRRLDLPAVVIVVSGDIQPEARSRVIRLGALDLIKKPVDAPRILEVLQSYGIGLDKGDQEASVQDHGMAIDLRDGYREIANVAMGRAADLLAQLLGVFVNMPIPNINLIAQGELHMALTHVADHVTVSAVCQGFIGDGIAGEALLIFNESSFSAIAGLMRYEGKADNYVQLELLMDISNILIGACLKGLGEQLGVSFNQGHPIVLGRHISLEKLLKEGVHTWQRTLAVEIGYSIENMNINCDLLILFTEDSITRLNEHLHYLLEE